MQVQWNEHPFTFITLTCEQWCHTLHYSYYCKTVNIDILTKFVFISNHNRLHKEGKRHQCKSWQKYQTRPIWNKYQIRQIKWIDLYNRDTYCAGHVLIHARPLLEWLALMHAVWPSPTSLQHRAQYHLWEHCC